MQIQKILLLAAVFAWQTPLAQAETTTRSVGGTSYNFAVPRDFCVLYDSNSRDAIFINVVSTLLKGASNQLIVLTVNCDRLRTWRNGVAGNIIRYAMYYIPNNLVSASFPGDTQKLRKDLCDDMRKQGDATLAGVKDIVAKAAKELNSNVAVTGTKYVGVIDEDTHGCYAALLINVKGADGKTIVMSSIVTSTVVHSKPIFFAIYNEYGGPDTTMSDVERSKVVAAEFDQANP